MASQISVTRENNCHSCALHHPYDVYVDGKSVGKLPMGKELQIRLLGGFDYEIMVDCYSYCSKVIRFFLKENQTIEFKCNDNLKDVDFFSHETDKLSSSDFLLLQLFEPKGHQHQVLEPRDALHQIPSSPFRHDNLKKVDMGFRIFFAILSVIGCTLLIPLPPLGTIIGLFAAFMIIVFPDSSSA